MRLNDVRYLLMAAVIGGPLQAQAAGITDPVGDYLSGYTGSTAGDLDVLSASLTYNPSTDIFHFESNYGADVGTTPAGFYVLGINRGAGTARFAANGLPNVLFDTVIRFGSTGTGLINLLNTDPATVTPLLPSAITIQGKRLSADIAGALLPSAGLAKSDYTWNLWPRDGASGTGFPAISDFAPDTTNAAVQTVPAPAAVWLFGSVLGVITVIGKRRVPAPAVLPV
ncbi:hypothetical protein [Methylococcus sp. EFPC2]|uniref:hypothetical protein n=1 Tax=Methylococcus sp. EFPC2 TaxID=2812648 RepID=UPI0019683355|nr:hypothetical protein [Methylococcus sp. EFPC2]QSA97711.1 hypothetical protein JWZ97_02420 [Methylococcus sp. EFPC2]